MLENQRLESTDTANVQDSDHKLNLAALTGLGERNSNSSARAVGTKDPSFRSETAQQKDSEQKTNSVLPGLTVSENNSARENGNATKQAEQLVSQIHKVEATSNTRSIIRQNEHKTTDVTVLNKHEHQTQISAAPNKHDHKEGAELQKTGHADAAAIANPQHIHLDHDNYEHGDKKNPDNNTTSDKDDHELLWRGHTLIMNTHNGVPSNFRDENGNEWKSTDGKGWVRKGSHGIDARRETISYDAAKKQIQLQNPYGLKTVYSSDGSLTASFTTAKGNTVVQKSFADGSQEISNEGKVWQSKDGKTWTSGGEKPKADLHIDSFGRLMSSDKIESQSAESSAIAQKVHQLEHAYKINIGETGSKILLDDESKKELELRMPTIDELNILDGALQKYAQVARNNGTDFRGLTFNFVSPSGNGASVTEHGWHNGGAEPNINIAPRDAAQPSGWDGFEGTALHEIAHQLQDIRWKNSKGVEEVPRKIEAFFGYEKVMPPATPQREGTYRLSDAEGHKWQHEAVAGGDELWMPVRNGKVSTDPEAGITDKTLRAKMAPERRPATDYFFHPQESHAEAMAMLLFDAKMLWQQNPALYDATKKWDQEDINHRYGFKHDAAGNQIPKMMRSSDRHIVPTNKENLQQLKDWEEHWKNSASSQKFAALPPRGRCACHA